MDTENKFFSIVAKGSYWYVIISFNGAPYDQRDEDLILLNLIMLNSVLYFQNLL
jgi:hypothetical protein